MLYFFILGRNPALSLAEISSLIRARIIPLKKVIAMSSHFLILDLTSEIDAEALMSRVGGIIKIGKIIEEVRSWEFGVLSSIENLLFQNLTEQGYKRLNFGFSVYSQYASLLAPTHNSEHTTPNTIKSLALSLKRRLKESGIASRWVTSQGSTLSSVVVSKNKLLTQGAEFVFLTPNSEHPTPNFLGRTLAVQEFEEYGMREFGRPSRAIEKGMLPVKIAQIMINLAKTQKEEVLLDPFCGSGTILTEAMAMGYAHILGSDVSGEAIQRSKENILWMREQIQNKESTIELKRCDVRELSTCFENASIDAIVTEPYLGPLQTSRPLHKEIQKIVGELSSLYLGAFREFKKVLKPNDGRVVMVWPAFHTFFLPILDQVERLGFRVVEPLLPELSSLNLPELTSRGSIIYSRPDQHVLREIFVFQLWH